MNKNTPVIIFLIIAVILVIGIVLFVRNNSSVSPDSNSAATSAISTSTDSASVVSTSTEKTYSMNEVATHKDQNSCWTAINGFVYDVTTWINKHPGGPQAILGLCGKDGTSMFMGQHGGQTNPTNTLATFKIGVLQK